MVASVVFSVLLFASAAVYAASQGRAGLYAEADAAGRFEVGFAALGGAEGANVLIAVQGFLTSRPLPCSDALPEVASFVGTLRGLQGSGGLTVASSAELAQGAGGNVTALGQFGGFVPGDLDVALRLSGQGAAPGVRFNLTETSGAHLRVRIYEAVQECADDVASVEGALSGQRPAVCTDPGVAPLVGEAARGAESAASASGFGFEVSYRAVQMGGCALDFQIILTQSGVQGPAGAFTVRFEQGGSVRFGPPPSRLPP
jgi:hypothetical protein